MLTEWGISQRARFPHHRVMVLQVVFLVLCISAIATGAVLLLLLYARIESRRGRSAAIQAQLSERSAQEWPGRDALNDDSRLVSQDGDKLDLRRNDNSTAW